MDSLSDQYLVKAIEKYPYNLSEAVESLNYALSYDSENPVALKLMGQMYAEQLRDFPKAISYFEKALAVDPKNVEVFPHFISALIDYGNYDAALKASAFALRLKGTEKGIIHMLNGFCFEYMEKYKKALKSFEKSKTFTYNSYMLNHIKSCVKRVEDKMPNKKKGSKSKKNKKKKK